MKYKGIPGIYNSFKLPGKENQSKEETTVIGVLPALVANVIYGNGKGAFFSVVNIAKHDLAGLNIAGLGNHASNNISGFNVAGLLNDASRDLSGLNVAGFGNGASNNISGFNLAGLSNEASRDLSGLNVAGFVNIAYNNLFGVSISALNYSGSSNKFAAQAGVWNYIKSVSETAIQIGLWNHITTPDPEGFIIQIGIINRAGRTIIPGINITGWKNLLRKKKQHYAEVSTVKR